MELKALQKADSLRRHAAYLGVHPKEFVLTLTKGEGYELLDFLASGGMGKFADHALLLHDIDEAKLAGDPFLVLRHFQLEGFEIMPVTELN